MKNARKGQRERAKRKRSRKKPTANKQREKPLTISIPEAGRLLGLGRAASYEAARRGDLPFIKIGSRFLTTRAAVEKILAGI